MTLSSLDEETSNKRLARRNRPKEPNMGHGRGQIYMPEAFAPHGCARNFHAATVAGDSLVSYSAVFPAVTFIIFYGAKNAFGKKSVFLGTLGTIIYGFWLGDFAVRPSSFGRVF